jgi:hypothetical protein
MKHCAPICFTICLFISPRYVFHDMFVPPRPTKGPSMFRCERRDHECSCKPMGNVCGGGELLRVEGVLVVRWKRTCWCTICVAGAGLVLNPEGAVACRFFPVKIRVFCGEECKGRKEGTGKVEGKGVEGRAAAGAGVLYRG